MVILKENIQYLAMGNKQLYNIETDTLVTLYRKNMILEVKHDFTQIYHLKKTEFAIIYLLAISHPHIVNYKDFLHVLESLGEDILLIKQLDKLISVLKKELKSYGVKDFIIKVKRTGYAISNKWVVPSSPEAKSGQHFLKFVKKFLPVY